VEEHDGWAVRAAAHPGVQAKVARLVPRAHRLCHPATLENCDPRELRPLVVPIVQTLRSPGNEEEPMPPAGRRRGRSNAAAAEAAIVIVALMLMIAAAAAGYVVGRETADTDGGGGEPAAAETSSESETAETEGAETETTEGSTDEEATTEGGGGGGGGGGDPAAGKEIFASAGCASCHTFEDAGASGNIGPNLDQTGLSEEEIAQTVTEGRGGMPSFSDRLSEDEIAAVAAYVSESKSG